MKAVLSAGGKGTRIRSVAPDIPKPMIPLCGMPVLEREIYSLRDQGFCDIIITVGHLGHVITDYFGDGSQISPVTGKPFGVHIEYYVENTPLGSAGALLRLRDKLTEDFLFLNADAVFDVDFNRFVAHHRKTGAYATLFTHPNSHPYDSGLVVADSEGFVTAWLTKEDLRPPYYRNRVNAGLHILSPKLLSGHFDTERIDLDRQILKPLAGTGRLAVYDSPEYVKDMGTPERYLAVTEDYRRGIVAAKNLKNKQKAVFLDRDGTLNVYKGFIRDAAALTLMPGAAEAVRRINRSGYLAVLVTNQPVLARGEVTYEGLREIHNKLETLLGNEGAYLDAIYFCPHHPDAGFPGEVAALKTVCACRKPKPGMLYRAAEELHIDLGASLMVGDSESDMLAGKNAGCKTILLGSGSYGQDETIADWSAFTIE